MKTWFITGASRGLGLEIARAALEDGDQVVATARRPEQISSTLTGYGERLFSCALDVTRHESIEAAVQQTMDRFGRIDVLINNAGYGQLGAFEEVSDEAIVRQFRTNVFGTFSVTRGVLPILRAQRSGLVVTLSSIGGIIGFEGSSIYCSTKFALEGWSEALDLELRPFGLRAVLVEPGQFRTDFLDESSVAYGDLSLEDYAAFSQKRKAGLDERNHQQAGDPAKLGQIIVQLAASSDLPVRLALGTDAYQVVTGHADRLRVDAERWRDVTVSTDFRTEEQA